jgi:ferredoxin-NADP reductase
VSVDSAVTMSWQTARVVDLRPETPRAKTLRLRLAHSMQQMAGQYCIVRLTAPDGYSASRAYSIASPPGPGSEIELTVERLDDGEVSPFLHDEVAIGDELEVRGPIGGWFVWRGDTPAVLVGGGSGVVPLMAILRLARSLGRGDDVQMIVSVRSPTDLYYAGELSGAGVRIAYTRVSPPATRRPVGRLTLDDITPGLPAGAIGYVCGSAGFADHASDLLVAAGLDSDHIRVERFGPT